MLTGVTLVLYLLSMQALALRNRREWFLPLFSTCIFVVGTMYLIGSMFIGCKIFIDDRNIEGGPSQALVDIYWEPIVVMADVSFPLQSWLTDGLIIFRCFVIYSYNYWVILFPSFLLVGSLGLGIALNTELSRPGVGFWAKISKDLALPWFSCSIALNIVVTFLIVFRLLWHRKMIISALGAQHANQYVSISAMLIESATLSATCSIIFLILYARGNAVSTVFQDLVSYCQISASLLIILRVAKGHAWSGATTATTRPLSDLRFRKPGGPTSTMAQVSTLSQGALGVRSRDVQLHLEEGSSSDRNDVSHTVSADPPSSIRGKLLRLSEGRTD